MRQFAIIIFILTSIACCNIDKVPDSETLEYDNLEYCYNGFAIFEKNGRFGITDTCGIITLPARYDDISFVTDNYAIVGEGDTWSLVSPYGKVLAESDRKENLISNCGSIIRNKQIENILLWDSILENFDSLCNLAIRGNSEDLSNMMEMLDEIKELSDQSKDKMTDQQLSRFEGIIDRYNYVKEK